MNLAVRFTTEASEELRDAGIWYEDRQAGLGLVFMAAVDRAVDHASRWPTVGALIEDVESDVEIRRTPITRFPYYVAYIAHDDRVTILAIAHQHRRPHYWVDRID